LRDIMSYEAPEILSQEELRRRLREVIAQHPDGREVLHKPETRLRLRLSDIADCIGCEGARLYRFSHAETDRFPADLQRRLSWFFHAWDLGRLRKELVGAQDGKRRRGAVKGRGVLVYRGTASPPVPSTATGSKPIRIEVTAQGPKLRL
jgi:hypothetical protein